MQGQTLSFTYQETSGTPLTVAAVNFTYTDKYLVIR